MFTAQEKYTSAIPLLRIRTPYRSFLMAAQDRRNYGMNSPFLIYLFG